MSSYFFVSIKNSGLAKDPDMDPLNINFNEQSRLIIMQGLPAIPLAITKVMSI